MNLRRLITQSLRYHWRTHLGVALGAAVATATLVGALVVGDSVRATLRHIALARLGNTHLAMTTGDRSFTTQLARDIAADFNAPAAAAIDLNGIAIVPGSERRAAGIHVIGVDHQFWAIDGTEPPLADDASDRVALNHRLAEQLRVKVGDVVLLRVARPSALSRDIPLGSDASDSATLRLIVGAIIDADRFGAFSLRAEQMPPFNAFVPLSLLQEEAGLDGRANLLLIGTSHGSPAHAADQANASLRSHWRLADAQLELRALREQGVVELRSDRVFLDPPLVEAAGNDGQKSITYFVNELRGPGDRATPYSMATAFAPDRSELLPDHLAENDIVITQWLADDLAAGVGDEVVLKYYVTGDARQLTEHEAKFVVRGIVPTEPPGGDRHLMPEFPGLTDADSPLDWEPPPDLNIDLSRIRSQDEEYWERHRGAPKAFVSLNWAERHWSTRFGTLTAVRWPLDMVTPDALASSLRSKLEPAALGLFLRDVRTPALQASEQGYDFGQLFIGFSLFLIAAALLLTALMFAFGVERRTPEVGTLLAIGFTPRRVRSLLLGEGIVLAVIGAVIGLPLGVLYTRAILWALTNLWRDAVGLVELRYHANARSLVIGAVAGIVMAVLAMLWALRRQGRQSARALLAARYGLEPHTGRGGRKWNVALAGALIITAIVIGAAADQDHAAGAFFAAGGLLLIGGLVACSGVLRPAARSTDRLTLTAVGWRNSGRRRGRSLATVSMLACGTFLLVAVNAFRHDPSHAPESATLGFELFAQTSLPINYDLNTSQGRAAFGLSDEEMVGVGIVQMRLLEGDDASCLNLNQPQAPPLLGVDPAKMDGDPWRRLDEGDGESVPALVDEAVGRWVLHKGVGDTIKYLDEAGRPLTVQIVGTLPKSILQGYLVISEERLKRHFPSRSGYRVLLIDTPDGQEQRVAGLLDRALANVGITTMRTVDRLALFSAVENTYLSIFSVLGGLGVLLGCVGLALVVLRNVLERRAELAVMRAMGFRDRSLRWLLLAEHWGLVAMGLACGVASAIVAVAPSLRTAGSGLPYQTLLVILAAVALGALAWTAIAAGIALRGRLTPALRSE